MAIDRMIVPAMLFGFGLSWFVRFVPVVSWLFFGLPGRYKVWSIAAITIFVYGSGFVIYCLAWLPCSSGAAAFVDALFVTVGGIGITLIASQAGYTMFRKFGDQSW